MDAQKVNKNLLMALIIVLLLYFFLYAAMQQSLLSHNVYDSYTIQAVRWWQGEITLEQDYSWLELAYYKGNIYVSFPPFPSVPMFLLVPLFGANTPSNMVTSLYAILSFLVVFLFCRREGKTDSISLFWAAFIVFGSNLLHISLFGGVWYQAQVLSFFMSVLSIYFITSQKEWHWHMAMMCWAFAIGCRPFQIIYLPVYVYYLYLHMKRQNKGSLSIARYFIIPAVVGMIYGGYNLVRFDSVFEFGHNYLPEFTEAAYGQFHWRYVLKNIPNLFRLPYFKDNLLTFPKFDGFAFYVANPIFIAAAARFVWGCIQKKLSPLHYILTLCAILHILLFLSHKTLGGWQFGIRYFVDLIPFFLFPLLLNMRVRRSDILLFAFGLMLNLYGTFWLMLEWD